MKYSAGMHVEGKERMNSTCDAVNHSVMPIRIGALTGAVLSLARADVVAIHLPKAERRKRATTKLRHSHPYKESKSCLGTCM